MGVPGLATQGDCILLKSDDAGEYFSSGADAGFRNALTTTSTSDAATTSTTTSAATTTTPAAAAICQDGQDTQIENFNVR
jgi:hypothetical protein